MRIYSPYIDRCGKASMKRDDDGEWVRRCELRQLSINEQSCLVFSARYAHTRNTGACGFVIDTIIANAGMLSIDIKKQLCRDALSGATCNRDDWQRMIDVLKEK